MVAALLTLVGYSMNDTIVTFDRIRENLKIMRREQLETIINKSVNQTLSRTVLTSGLTLLTALALLLFGGQVLNGFCFRPGVRHYRWYLFVGLHCKSDPDLLAEFAGEPQARRNRSSGGPERGGRAATSQRSQVRPPHPSPVLPRKEPDGEPPR